MMLRADLKININKTDNLLARLNKRKRDRNQIHNGILLSHKKNDIMPFAATWMELEVLILRELNQKEKDKYHMT